ncbi:MAG: hypothetical protein FGM15_09610 [Chthoniobacterales bacterium]|nr:hypothetical protein [Chthoniobacterales bacterium]
MMKKFLATFVLFAFCAAGAVAEVEWDPEIYPDSQIFPSLIIGTAAVKPENEVFAMWEGNHIGDRQGVVGASVEGVSSGSTVELEVRENDIMNASHIKGTAENNDALTIYPKISWKYDRLAKVKQTVPIDVTMELKVDGKSLGDKTVTATLRTVNDCLFGVMEPGEEENYSDYSWLFAAYVNENHPWVDRTLKEALDTKIVSSFDDYQSGDPQQVLRQVFAIWNVMQRKGLRYSNVVTTAAESESVHSQHVRLFDESVKAAQANCVDGSVLLAAVLRKIGLDPHLVSVPGHMFLAFSLDDETMVGLETTMMGDADLPAVDGKRLRSFLKFDPEQRKNDESWATFEAALDTGTQALVEASDKFGEDPDYQLIDLQAARNLGILPVSSAVTD